MTVLTTKCESCGREHVEVELDLKGATLRMRSCTACDRREWVGPEGPLELPEVLDAVADRVGR